MFSLPDLSREHPVIFTFWLIVQCFVVCLFAFHFDFLSFYHAVFIFVIEVGYIVLMMIITRDW